MLPGDIFFSITKGPPKIVAELLHKVQKYMNVEDAVVATEITGKRKIDEETSRHPKKKKEMRSVRQILDKKKNIPDQRYTTSSPL